MIAAHAVTPAAAHVERPRPRSARMEAHVACIGDAFRAVAEGDPVLAADVGARLEALRRTERVDGVATA